MPSIKEALQQARHLGLPPLEAQILLLHTCGQDTHNRAWLLLHDDEPLTASAHSQFLEACQRRLAGEPIAYITGEKAFYGLRLQISPAVLDPRDDSETLVDWALDLLQSAPAPDPVLDLGTGSGAIALAIAHNAPQAAVHAVDLSPQALEQAQHNGRRLGITVHWHLSHWFDQLQGLHFGLIVSNPPYIAEGDPHLAALRHEPTLALTSGPDGLDAIRHIIQAAPPFLQTGAWLLLEHGYDQADAVADLLRAGGFQHISHRQDLAGIRRCTGGQWLSPTGGELEVR